MPTDPYAAAYALAAQRDDVLLAREATALGLTDWAQRPFRRADGLAMPRGTLALPPIRDPVRTKARATQLLIPDAVISHVTGARIHGLGGLQFWSPTEPVDATLEPSATRWQRRSTRLHFQPLQADDVVNVDGLLVTPCDGRCWTAAPGWPESLSYVSWTAR